MCFDCTKKKIRSERGINYEVGLLADLINFKSNFAMLCVIP